jgi:hypothetical protein
MACEFHTGKHHRVEVATQTFASGDSFGGAALTAQCFRVASDGFSFEKMARREPIDELDPAVSQFIGHGSHYAWSLKCIMDWDERDNLMVMLMKDTPATSGTGPYVHVLQLGIERYFGNVVGWYTTADEQTIISETLTDCWVTGGTLSIEANGALILELSGIAKGKTRDDSEASLPTITATTPITAEYITTLSMGGETDFRLANLNLAVNQPSTEDEGYGLAASGSGALDFIDINERREVTVDLSIRSNETVVSTMDPGTEIAGPTVTFNNGEAGADEREFKIELGKCEVRKRPDAIATISRISQDVSLQATDQDGYDLQITMTNGNATVPIP